jgi:hypothetical protein
MIVSLPALPLDVKVWSQAAKDFPLLLDLKPSGILPFEVGEELTYEVNWKPLFFFPAFKAGEIKLAIQESELGGVETFRIRGWATSEGALARVAGFQVNNYFESDIDRYNFRSYRSLQQTRQGERERDLLLRFNYQTNQTFVHETDPAADPPREIRKSTRKGIPAPAIDVLSVFYVARLRTIQPGDRFIVHLNQTGTFRNVQVIAEGYEEVRTPVGNFSSIKISTKGGLFRDGGDFRIWYSLDQQKVPTRFEADVKFGKVYGDLIRFKSSQLTRSRLKTE